MYELKKCSERQENLVKKGPVFKRNVDGNVKNVCLKMTFHGKILRSSEANDVCISYLIEKRNL